MVGWELPALVSLWLLWPLSARGVPLAPWDHGDWMEHVREVGEYLCPERMPVRSSAGEVLAGFPDPSPKYDLNRASQALRVSRN